MKRNAILSVLGSGHSGSTIPALGSHQDCFSLGEVSEIQTEVDNNTLCVCGDSISTCQFWTAVDKILLKTHKIHIKLGGNFCIKPPAKRKRSFSDKLITFLKFIGLLNINDTWTINAKHLYTAISRTSNADILVDSSKNFIRALLIKQALKQYDIKFLHLVRDVRGVAYSYSKKDFSLKLPGQKKIEVTRGRDIYAIKSISQLWKNYNRKISQLLNFFVPKEHIERIKYEELCSQPDTVLHDICTWLNLEYSETMKKFSTKIHHNIGGNPSRFNSTEINHIDEKWQSALSEEDKLGCLQVAGRLNKAFGYH